MKSNKGKARMIGVLFLAAMAGSLVGGVGFVEPSLGSPDFLQAVNRNSTQVQIGVLLELVNALSVAGIGVLMFSFLRQDREEAAVGYLALRTIEAVFCCLIVVAPLSLITLGERALHATGPDAAQLQAAGVLALAERAAISGLLVPIFMGIGGLVLYASLYRSRLLPRYISVWGWIGAALILALNLLLTAGVELGDMGMLFALPIITNEIWLGFRLIFKGFRSPEAAAAAA